MLISILGASNKITESVEPISLVEVERNSELNNSYSKPAHRPRKRIKSLARRVGDSTVRVGYHSDSNAVTLLDGAALEVVDGMLTGPHLRQDRAGIQPESPCRGGH